MSNPTPGFDIEKFKQDVNAKIDRDVMASLYDLPPQPLRDYGNVVAELQKQQQARDKRMEILKKDVMASYDIMNGWDNASPCMSCGQMSCSQGVKYCNRCVLANSAAPEGIPHTHQQDTIKGWKVGYIVKEMGKGYRFRGVTQIKSYGIEDRFECLCRNSISKHTSLPFEKQGRCGFYASKWPRGPLECDNFDFLARRLFHQDIWLLEVELYGRVHKHRDGYKAEKQRVLSVRPFAQPKYPESRWGLNDFVGDHLRNVRYTMSEDDIYSLRWMFDIWRSDAHQANTYMEYVDSQGARLLYGIPEKIEKGRTVGTITRSELTAKLGTSVREWDADHCVQGEWEAPINSDYVATGGMCGCVLCTGAIGGSPPRRYMNNNIWVNDPNPTSIINPLWGSGK